jgi:ABC-type multidrug transport system fused ATPase/permease subunit
MKVPGKRIAYLMFASGIILLLLALDQYVIQTGASQTVSGTLSQALGQVESFLSYVSIQLQPLVTRYWLLFPTRDIGYAATIGFGSSIAFFFVWLKRRKPTPLPKRTMRRLLAYVKPNWGYVLVIVIMLLASSSLDLAQPWIRGFLLFNGVIAQKNLGFLPFVLAIIAVTFAASQVTGFMRDYFTEVLSQKVLHNLRVDLFQHIERLPLRFHEQTQSGDLVSRILSDTDEVQSIMTDQLTSLVADLITVLGSIALLFYVGPSMAITIVPVIVALVIVVNLFKRRIKRSSRSIRQAVSQLYSRVYEVLPGIRIVKSFSQEDAETKDFQKRSRAIWKSNVSLQKLSSFYSSTVDLMTTLALLAMLSIAVPQVVYGSMTLGALVAFIGYMDKLFSPLVDLSKSNFKFQKALTAGDRIFELMDQKAEDLEEGRQPGFIRGQVEFARVSFQYVPGRKVLDDFSLVIQPGETVAIVGPSGAGKSTVVNLLQRFYDPTNGTILIDGYPVDKFKISFLRKNIGLVLQEPVLFSGTIRDNIAFGNPDAPDEDVVLAAKAAHVHEFISNLPDGYNSILGERGVNLSVGQRQRIAIARALLKDPRILILDEATSNVDSESEVLIQEAMKTLIRGRTTIVIAHRLSTIMEADRIVVLVDGKIAEIGTHESLIAKGQAYTRLYEAQLRPQIAVPARQSGGWHNDGEVGSHMHEHTSASTDVRERRFTLDFKEPSH